MNCIIKFVSVFSFPSLVITMQADDVVSSKTMTQEHRKTSPDNESKLKHEVLA